MTSAAVRVPDGAATTSALGDILREQQGEAALAAVDVAVPSSVAGVTGRRKMVDPRPANMRSTRLPQVAEPLALRSLVLSGQPLSATVRAHVVRAPVAAVSGALAKRPRRLQSGILVGNLFGGLDQAEAPAEFTEVASCGSAAHDSLYEVHRTGVDDVPARAATIHSADQSPNREVPR